MSNMHNFSEFEPLSASARDRAARHFRVSLSPVPFRGGGGTAVAPVNERVKIVSATLPADASAQTWRFSPPLRGERVVGPHSLDGAPRSRNSSDVTSASDISVRSLALPVDGRSFSLAVGPGPRQGNSQLSAYQGQTSRRSLSPVDFIHRQEQGRQHQRHLLQPQRLQEQDRWQQQQEQPLLGLRSQRHSQSASVCTSSMKCGDGATEQPGPWTGPLSPRAAFFSWMHITGMEKNLHFAGGTTSPAPSFAITAPKVPVVAATSETFSAGFGRSVAAVSPRRVSKGRSFELLPATSSLDRSLSNSTASSPVETGFGCGLVRDSRGCSGGRGPGARPIRQGNYYMSVKGSRQLATNDFGSTSTLFSSTTACGTALLETSSPQRSRSFQLMAYGGESRVGLSPTQPRQRLTPRLSGTKSASVSCLADSSISALAMSPKDSVARRNLNAVFMLTDSPESEEFMCCVLEAFKVASETYQIFLPSFLPSHSRGGLDHCGSGFWVTLHQVSPLDVIGNEHRGVSKALAPKKAPNKRTSLGSRFAQLGGLADVLDPENREATIFAYVVRNFKSIVDEGAQLRPILAVEAGLKMGTLVFNKECEPRLLRRVVIALEEPGDLPIACYSLSGFAGDEDVQPDQHWKGAFGLRVLDRLRESGVQLPVLSVERRNAASHRLLLHRIVVLLGSDSGPNFDRAFGGRPDDAVDARYVKDGSARQAATDTSIAGDDKDLSEEARTEHRLARPQLPATLRGGALTSKEDSKSTPLPGPIGGFADMLRPGMGKTELDATLDQNWPLPLSKPNSFAEAFSSAVAAAVAENVVADQTVAPPLVTGGEAPAAWQRWSWADAAAVLDQSNDNSTSLSPPMPSRNGAAPDAEAVPAAWATSGSTATSTFLNRNVSRVDEPSDCQALITTKVEEAAQAAEIMESSLNAEEHILSSGQEKALIKVGEHCFMLPSPDEAARRTRELLRPGMEVVVITNDHCGTPLFCPAGDVRQGLINLTPSKSCSGASVLVPNFWAYMGAASGTMFSGSGGYIRSSNPGVCGRRRPTIGAAITQLPTHQEEDEEAEEMVILHS